MHRSYADSTRTDWDGRGLRPLETTVWYPAASGSREAEWTAGAFHFGRGAPGAAFADAARRPLVVLSHGTAGSAAQLSWLAEALAAAGFVVAAVDHHGNTATEERYRPHGFVLPWERARDLSVVIDRLFADPVVRPHIDETRVGAAGFSLGGYTVLALAGAHLTFADWQRRCAAQPDGPGCTLPPEAPFTRADLDSLARADAPFRAGVTRGEQPTRDARIRAVYAMAPALVPALDTASLRAIAVPVRVVLGGADTQVLPGPTAAMLARFVPSAAVEQLPGIAHYAFLAPCTWRGRVFVRALCSEGGTARVTLHHRISADAVRFFRGWLAPSAAHR
jgi:predicted dienelactone hydrolase